MNDVEEFAKAGIRENIDMGIIAELAFKLNAKAEDIVVALSTENDTNQHINISYQLLLDKKIQDEYKQAETITIRNKRSSVDKINEKTVQILSSSLPKEYEFLSI